METFGGIKRSKGISEVFSIISLYPYPYPETSVTLGMPRDVPYCSVHSIPFRRPPYRPEGLPYDPETSGGCPTAQGPQEAALWPADCPYSPSSLPYLQAEHTQGTQHTQASRKGLRGHTDYKTTRLQISQPTESITKQPNGGKYRENPDRGRYREKPSGGKYREKPDRGKYREKPTEANCTELLLKENT